MSTLFPQLSRSSRRVFGLLLAGFVVTLAVLVALRWQAASIGVAVFGFPVLLASYLYDVRVRPRRIWLFPVILGVLLGVAWALVIGVWVAHNYGIGFGAGLAGGPNTAAIGVPVGAVIVLVLPAVLIRILGRSATSVMDGLVVGVLGATSVGVAATVVRLWPQLATGLVARHRPLEGLLLEAGIRGVVIPMTSAAIGGIAGVALWFPRGRDTSPRRPLLVLALLTGIAVAARTALVDTSRLEFTGELLLHGLVTAIALYGLRFTLHLALMHETHQGGADELSQCPECGHEVCGAAAYCPSCGRACATWPAQHSVTGFAAYRGSVSHVAAGLAGAAVFAMGVSLVLTKPVALYACPPECGSPPTGTAVKINPRITGADGQFSVAYPAPGSAYDVTTKPNGVVAVFNRGDGGELRLFGEPARGRTAEQVVRDFLADNKPKARRAYSIPNATVGYQPGFGEVDDDYPVSAAGGYVHLRLVTMAAVKNDYAVIAAAIGPFHQFGPEFGPGPPSAVSLQLGLDMDNYVNSFRWRGDPDD